MLHFEDHQVEIILLFGKGHHPFLFYLGLQLIGLGLPILGRAICFTRSTNLNVNPSRNILTETPKIMFD